MMRARKVLLPIKAKGKCPQWDSSERLEEQACNIQPCMGDELCVAQQDLILALDSSGSILEEGFKTMQKFAVDLTSRYRTEYFGLEAMKIGVVLFGNGDLKEFHGNWIISPALKVQELTEDLSLVRMRIDQLTWQRGFKNLPQALSLAEVMLQQGRQDAQSAVLVLSDGQFASKHQTAEKAQELKDKNVQIFMAPIADFEGEKLDVLKEWASQPWEANYERVPGLAALTANTELFAERLITKFCPDVFSPSQMEAKEAANGYMLVRERGWPSKNCGSGHFYIGNGYTMDECAEAARTMGHTAFVYGKGSFAGGCYAEAIEVTQMLWEAWQDNRATPACTGGYWQFTPYYDTYAFNPNPP